MRKRAVTALDSFDLIDTEYLALKKIVPAGNLKGMDSRKIKSADKFTSLFMTGLVTGKDLGDHATVLEKVLFLEGEQSSAFQAPPQLPFFTILLSHWLWLAFNEFLSRMAATAI